MAQQTDTLIFNMSADTVNRYVMHLCLNARLVLNRQNSTRGKRSGRDWHQLQRRGSWHTSRPPPQLPGEAAFSCTGSLIWRQWDTLFTAYRAPCLPDRRTSHRWAKDVSDWQQPAFIKTLPSLTSSINLTNNLGNDLEWTLGGHQVRRDTQLRN